MGTGGVRRSQDPRFGMGVPCSGSAPEARGSGRIAGVGTGTHGGGLVDHAVEPVVHYSEAHDK